MGWFFLFFFVSGFCSILYEIVWLRLSMAQFGVTSALVSIVLSMFMAGLGLGSWGAGYAIRKYGDRFRIPALRIYAFAELLIGISALVVPVELGMGRNLLERVSITSSWAYYLFSGAWVALTLVPWCACMGATIPLAMQAIKRSFQREAHRSFSFLYLANVLGAVAGATVPLFLIEMYGFHGTLRAGAMLNGLLFVLAMGLTLISPAGQSQPSPETPIAPVSAQLPAGNKPLVLLFLTGLTSMGAEVVWIRQFTPTSVPWCMPSRLFWVFICLQLLPDRACTVTGAAATIWKVDWSGERSGSCACCHCLQPALNSWSRISILRCCGWCLV